jgi:hypothetical protein
LSIVLESEEANKQHFINIEVHCLFDMQLRKIAVSAFLLGLGVYIWLPTADEIVIHPTFGLFSPLFCT